jgi:hypothetical protein
MGCNCGGKGNQAKVNFVYVSPKGERKVYKTEVEARAAQIRNGGGTYNTVRAA